MATNADQWKWRQVRITAVSPFLGCPQSHTEGLSAATEKLRKHLYLSGFFSGNLPTLIRRLAASENKIEKTANTTEQTQPDVNRDVIGRCAIINWADWDAHTGWPKVALSPVHTCKASANASESTGSHGEICEASASARQWILSIPCAFFTSTVLFQT